MRTKRWHTYLEGVDDVLDWEVRRERGRIVSFTINYRTRIEERWVEVCRYDTCHGYRHLHRFWKEDPAQVQSFPHQKVPAHRYHAAFRMARDDLAANWERYRRLRLARDRGGSLHEAT